MTTALRDPADVRGAAALRADDGAWDDFVKSAPQGTFPQLTPWAVANASKGWLATRVVAEGDAGPTGAQVLIHRMGRGPWSRGYATRGPVARSFTRDGVAAFTEELSREARRLRLSHVFADPEIPRGDPLGELFVEAGWRRRPNVQPNRTRVLDLTVPEEQLWGGLRSSARWSVNKCRRSGVTIEEASDEALPEFAALYHETAERAHFKRRADHATVFRAFRAAGAATLLMARDHAGVAIAALMLLACGPRIVEIYGASSTAGGRARANYLVKWEAISRSRQRGFRLYDMWGTDEPWIAEFKEGFGGQERFFDGGFELVTSRTAWMAVSAIRRARGIVSRNGTAPLEQSA